MKRRRENFSARSSRGVCIPASIWMHVRRHAGPALFRREKCTMFRGFRPHGGNNEIPSHGENPSATTVKRSMPSTEGNKTSVNLRIYVSRLRRRLANSGAVVAVMRLILHASGHRKYVLASPLRLASRNIYSLLRRNENEYLFLSSSPATRLSQLSETHFRDV